MRRNSAGNMGKAAIECQPEMKLTPNALKISEVTIPKFMDSWYILTNVAR